MGLWDAFHIIVPSVNALHSSESLQAVNTMSRMKDLLDTRSSQSAVDSI